MLKVNQQEEIFVKAYEEVGPANVRPHTLIPGLSPMVRMHYSYVCDYVKDSPEHLSLLKKFWQKAAPLVESNQITVGRMRNITVQLAFLLSNMHGYEDLEFF